MLLQRQTWIDDGYVNNYQRCIYSVLLITSTITITEVVPYYIYRLEANFGYLWPQSRVYGSCGSVSDQNNVQT